MKLPLVVSTRFFMLATSIFLVATFALHDYMHAIRRLHASTRFITCMYGKIQYTQFFYSVHCFHLFSTLNSSNLYNRSENCKALAILSEPCDWKNLFVWFFYQSLAILAKVQWCKIACPILSDRTCHFPRSQVRFFLIAGAILHTTWIMHSIPL